MVQRPNTPTTAASSWHTTFWCLSAKLVILLIAHSHRYAFHMRLQAASFQPVRFCRDINCSGSSGWPWSLQTVYEVSHPFRTKIWMLTVVFAVLSYSSYYTSHPSPGTYLWLIEIYATAFGWKSHVMPHHLNDWTIDGRKCEPGRFLDWSCRTDLNLSQHIDKNRQEEDSNWFVHIVHIVHCIIQIHDSTISIHFAFEESCADADLQRCPCATKVRGVPPTSALVVESPSISQFSPLDLGVNPQLFYLEKATGGSSVSLSLIFLAQHEKRWWHDIIYHILRARWDFGIPSCL